MLQKRDRLWGDVCRGTVEATGPMAAPVKWRYKGTYEAEREKRDATHAHTMAGEKRSRRTRTQGKETLRRSKREADDASRAAV